jgi:hypothetical protein
VSVKVDTDITKPGPNGTTLIVIPAGQQQLDGAKAVEFASFLASGELEQARLLRFDAVIKAVLAKLPTAHAQLARQLAGLGAGSWSSLSADKLADVVGGLAADQAATSISDSLLPVTQYDFGEGQLAYSLDSKGAADLVEHQFAQSVPAHRQATGNRVLVENQVGTPGLGETTRAKLIAAGFTYVAGENAPGMPNATAPSVVLIQGTTAAAIAQGNAVAKALGLPIGDVMVSQQPVLIADIVVLLGADYHP